MKLKFFSIIILLSFFYSCTPPTIEEQIQDLIEEEDSSERNVLSKILADSLNPKVPEIISGLNGINNSNEILNDLFSEYVKLSKNPKNASKVYSCLKFIPTNDAYKFLGNEIMTGPENIIALETVLSLKPNAKEKALFESLKYQNSSIQEKVYDEYYKLGNKAQVTALQNSYEINEAAVKSIIYKRYNDPTINNEMLWKSLVCGLKLNNFDNEFHEFIIKYAKEYGEPGIEELIKIWIEEKNENLFNSLVELGAMNFMLNKLGDTEDSEEFLAQMGKPAFNLLLTKMKNKDQNIRFAAADALVKMSNYHPDVLNELTSAVDNQSTRVIADNYPFYIRMGLASSQDLLIKTLEQHFSKNMCLDYLNCGNSYIENASKKIAARHGYSVYSEEGSFYGPKWGSGQ